MPIKEKKTALPKKNSLEYIVFVYILQNKYMSSISIQLNLNRKLGTRYYYGAVKRAIYRLREKQLVQCYGQRWVSTDNVNKICKLKKICQII